MIRYTNRTHGFDPLTMMRSLSRAIEQPADTRFPRVNLWQGDDAVALSAELPGVRPENIDISVQDMTLTLSGELEPIEVPDGATLHRNERRSGKFARSLRLPYRVDADNVEARFVDGVLQIALYRPEQDKPRRIEIKSS